tara:strand:- start:13074 stop:14705 length:1632 start_codon:yes stop_codon:yes gene_type:complete
MDVPYWALIEEHKRYYTDKLKPLWDTGLQYMNGNFYGVESYKERSVFKASFNLIFPMVETAVSSLLPPNPQASATPRGRMEPKAVERANTLMTYIFDTSRFRREAAFAITDSVICGAGAFKVVTRDGVPRIRNRSPRSLWWDPTARREEDIRYWIDCTPVSAGQMKAKIERGLYDPRGKLEPDSYPKFLLDDQFSSDARPIRDSFKWFTVYEVYDVIAGKVMHVTQDAVLLEADLDEQPFGLFNLNWNGEDMRGLSELHLVLAQQEEINALLSQLMRIAHLQVPKFLYDAGIIDEDDLSKALEGATGSFTAINMNADQLRSLKDAFFAVPTAQFSSEQLLLLDRLEKAMAVISAMADAARGQVSGAKTATEMAFIDAHQRTRLVTRKGNFEDAVDTIAGKAMKFAAAGMRPIELMVGEAEPVVIDPAEFGDTDLQWRMSSYSPIKQNSAIYAETVAALLPQLRDSETFRQRDIDLLLNEAFDLGLIPVPEEEIAAAREAAAASEQGGVGQLPAQQDLNPADVSAIPEQVSSQLPSADEQPKEA